MYILVRKTDIRLHSSKVKNYVFDTTTATYC